MVREKKKASKLNDFDRRVLLIYSDISLETGTKISAGTTEIKAIHKNKILKV